MIGKLNLGYDKQMILENLNWKQMKVYILLKLERNELMKKMACSMVRLVYTIGRGI